MRNRGLNRVPRLYSLDYMSIYVHKTTGPFNTNFTSEGARFQVLKTTFQTFNDYLHVNP